MLDVLGVASHADTAHERVAARGREDAGQHAQGRGLAGAVGPDEAEQLAARDIERQPVHGDRDAERATEIAQRDRGSGAVLERHLAASPNRTSAGMPGLRS